MVLTQMPAFLLSLRQQAVNVRSVPIPAISRSCGGLPSFGFG